MAQAVIHDLMRQSEVELPTPPTAPLTQFASLPDAQREALLCVSDIWREKLCLDRSFLSAVYRFGALLCAWGDGGRVWAVVESVCSCTKAVFLA